MTESKPTQLKPCPFCGGVSVIYEHGRIPGLPHLSVEAAHKDHCPLVGAMGMVPMFETEAEAITAWNTRSGDATELLREIRDWGLAPVFSAPMQEVRSDLLARIDAHLEGEA